MDTRHLAPTELNIFYSAMDYKHLAPTELSCFAVGSH